MLWVAAAAVDVEVGACPAGGIKVGSRVYANIKSVTETHIDGFHD